MFAVKNDKGKFCQTCFGAQPLHVALWLTRKDAERFAENMAAQNRAEYVVVEVTLNHD